MVHVRDLNELRRMATNFYGSADKECVSRILAGINKLVAENTKLKAEIQVLKNVQ